MRFLVLGGTGRIGSFVARDLVLDDCIDSVGIAGRSRDQLDRAASEMKSEKVSPHVLDIEDAGAVRRLMKEYDLAISALPDRRSSYLALEAAIDAGIGLVDVLEEYHRRPDTYEPEGLKIPEGMGPDEYGESLHRRAVDAGITVLDGMGFAPGLSNITLAEGIRQVGAESAVARVGGIPSAASAKRHPLKYMVTWSFDHVLREYMVKVRIRRNGRTLDVDATSGRESFRFSYFGQNAALEAAVTPGMPSFLHTMPHLKNFSEKTIRWPGHYRAIDALKSTGMLDMKPVEFRGVQVRPRDLLLKVLEPRLLPLEGDTDVCVMWNTATGRREGQEVRYDCYMWAEAPMGASAMAAVTGSSAAVGARLLSSGEIRERGIIAPEEGVKGEVYRRYIEGMEKRGAQVFDKISFTALPGGA